MKPVQLFSNDILDIIMMIIIMAITVVFMHKVGCLSAPATAAHD